MSLFTYLMVVINRMFENNVIIIIVFLVYHSIRYFEVFLMYQLLGTSKKTIVYVYNRSPKSWYNVDTINVV